MNRTTPTFCVTMMLLPLVLLSNYIQESLFMGKCSWSRFKVLQYLLPVGRQHIRKEVDGDSVPLISRREVAAPAAPRPFTQHAHVLGGAQVHLWLPLVGGDYDAQFLFRVDQDPFVRGGNGDALHALRCDALVLAKDHSTFFQEADERVPVDVDPLLERLLLVLHDRHLCEHTQTKNLFELYDHCSPVFSPRHFIVNRLFFYQKSISFQFSSLFKNRKEKKRALPFKNQWKKTFQLKLAFLKNKLVI